MNNFKTFLAESKNFDSLLSAIPYLQYDMKKQRLTDAVLLFNKAMDEKEIYNAEFKDAYTYGVSRNLEDAYRNVKDQYIEKFRENNFEDDIDSLFSLVSLKKHHKHFEKYKDKYPEVFQFLDNIKDVPDKIKELKKYIVKGKKPTKAALKKKEEISKFQKSDNKDILEKIFRKIGDDLKKDYYKHTHEDMIKAVERVHKDSEGKTHSELFSPTKGSLSRNKYMFLLRKIYTFKGVSGRVNSPLHRVDNWKELVKNEAEYQVAMFYNSFIEKNSMKLNGILKGRKIKNLKPTIRSHNLTGSLKVDLSDGSGFVMNFSVVTKVSKNGKFFNQFPTRFFNVIMADGTRMKAPSELKMKKEF